VLEVEEKRRPSVGDLNCYQQGGNMVVQVHGLYAFTLEIREIKEFLL